MMDLPHLFDRDVKEELGRLWKAERSGRSLVALFGTGKEDTVTIEPVGEFAIVPVESELELREKMPPLEDGASHIAFLVPWRGEVPLDLAGRFILNGRVQRIDPDHRLASLCGVRDAPGLGSTNLARYLLRSSNPRKSYAIAAGEITEAALWGAWLAADWNVDVSGGVGRDALLAWAAIDGRGPQFVEQMKAADAAGVRDDLLAFLARALGPVGPCVVEAWERGAGRLLLEIAVLCETLEAIDDPIGRVWLDPQLKALVGAARARDMPEVAKALGETAPLALRFLERKGYESEVAGIVAAADRRVDRDDVRRALVKSERLPSAWSMRLEQVGAALARGIESPSAASVAEAAAKLKALETHALFQDPSQTPVVKRAEMAVRLLAWLVARHDRELEGPDADWSDVASLGRWYAEEGGFVDWARKWARGSAEGALGRAVLALVNRVDEERAALDERFARALAHWAGALRPSSGVIPIDQALKRIAVPFLEEESSRKLLVLLLDGMAWAQAVELLLSLGSRPHGFAPIAWHTMQRADAGPYPVVIANLPTVTEVSRSAFFAGKEMPKGSALDTSKDDERFRENRALYPFCTQGTWPRLLLRGEGHTPDGSASQEALNLIADKQRRIVAIVINAIDASLKGDTQQQTDWTVDTIRPLADLLEAARQHGRTVLLASDHGHVRADRGFRPMGRVEAGARWRAWLGDGDKLEKGERRFRGAGVYTPKGVDEVVLLTTDDVRYGGGAHAGEHGGATLAEVVAPCVLIGWADPMPDTPESMIDKALKARPAYVPDWWHFEVRAAIEPRQGAMLAATGAAAGTGATAPSAPKPPAAPKAPKGVLEGQLGLPEVLASGSAAIGPTPAPASPTAAAPALPAQASAASVAPAAGATGTNEEAGAAIRAFAACEMLKARAPKAADREQVARAVALLLSRGGAMSADLFAQHLGEIAYRIEGRIRGLQEILNVDGYAVLRYDPRTRQVSLDKPKLEQQFEVDL